MNLRHVIPVVAALTLAAAIPASACDGHSKNSATTASAGGHSCSGMSRSTAWAGAWMQRSGGGELTVVAVAEGSPAAKSGLRAGDVVLAVNGRSISEKSSHMCADGTACSVGSAFAYTVQRGKATKTVKVKLEKMPADATTRFATVEASYEPALAAMVIPSVD
jgi:C-terminal processing protease CtpA/Prc